MLSAAGGCELTTTTFCENRLEEVQGVATHFVFKPSLFQDTWPCVQLLCVEQNVPCQWNLAIYKGKPPVSAGKWQSNDQTDLRCKTALHCHVPSGPESFLQQLGIENLDLILKERRLRWYRHVECSNDAFDIQVLGKHGPGRPKMT